MTSPNQIDKYTSRLFFNLIELDPKDEEESMFMSVLSDMMSKHGLDAMPRVSCEDLRIIGANLPFSRL